MQARIFQNDNVLLSADDWKAYRPLQREFPLGVVHHSRDEYVCGAIHTNTIEGFWSIVKRGIVGTFHKASKKYLPLYEFEFRENNIGSILLIGQGER